MSFFITEGVIFITTNVTVDTKIEIYLHDIPVHDDHTWSV